MPIVSISINYASLSQLNTGTSTVLSIQPAVLRSFFTQGVAAPNFSLKSATIRSATHNGALSIGGNLVVGANKFVVLGSLGRVGINNSSPTVTLDVAYPTNNILLTLNNTSNARSSYIASNAGLQLYPSSNSDNIQIRDASSTTIVTYSPSTNRIGILRTATNYPLEVQGTCTATSYEGDGSNLTGLLPIGSIIEFAGTTGQIPTGWILCDGRSASGFPSLITTLQAAGNPYGSSGGVPLVPDLRGRTVVGAGTGSGLTTRSVGQTGGVESVIITSSQSALPEHRHRFASQTTRSDNNRFNSPASIFSGQVHTSGSNPAQNADSAHNNVQPFLAVNKIIRGQ